MEEIKIITLNKLAYYDSLIKLLIDSKVFVGTTEEYEAAYAEGTIQTGTIVILTDDNTATSSSTTSVLGQAVLGKMILA